MGICILIGDFNDRRRSDAPDPAYRLRSIRLSLGIGEALILNADLPRSPGSIPR